MYMTLPLPSSARTICFVVVPSDGSAPPTTYGVQVPKEARVSDALALLGAQVCVTGISCTGYAGIFPFPFSCCVLLHLLPFGASVPPTPAVSCPEWPFAVQMVQA